MKKTKTSLFLVVVIGLLTLRGLALAVEVLESGYVVETYAAYSEPGITGARFMTFDDEANLYVTQGSDSDIWIITPEGNASKFASALGEVRGIVWAGGTDFGNYLYVVKAAVSGGKIYRIDLDGTVSTFVSVSCATPLALDRAGNYGGYLYYATRCQDHTYRVDINGSVMMFSDFPGWKDGGGPLDIAFDPGADYGGLMYMTVAFNNSHGNQLFSGLFSLDAYGSASRFTNDLVSTSRVAFDRIGDFDGEMFVTGIPNFDQSETLGSLWRVGSDGTATEFARTTASHLTDLEFGLDGAMYVAEYSDDDELVIISRICPADSRHGSRSKCVGEKHWKRQKMH